MKKRKSILIFAVVIFTAAILCLPAIVAAGGKPNPPAGVGDTEKVNGGKHGVIIAVWTPPTNGDIGFVDAFLRMDGHIYYRELPDYPESEFIPPEPDDPNFEDFYNNASLTITAIALPDDILEDFGLDQNCVSFGRAEILHEKICPKDNPDCTNAVALALYTKDVQNLVFERIDTVTDYVRVLHCDVKVSFICPK